MKRRLKAKGFADDAGAGQDLADYKAKILAQKGHRPIDAVGGFSGSDSVANSVPPEGTAAATPAATGAADAGGGDAGDAGAAGGTTTGDLITVTKAELAAIINQQADTAARRMNAQALEQNKALAEEVDRIRNLHTAERQTLTAEIDSAARETDRLKGILMATGSTGFGGSDATHPARSHSYAVNTSKFPTMREPRGAAKDFADMLSNPMYVPRVEKVDRDEGHIVQRNYAEIDAWARDPKIAPVLRQEMSELMKAHGLLTGGDASRDSAGSTRNVPSSIPDYFLPYLSSYLRDTHTARDIWWQFANQVTDIGQMPGQTVKIPRFENLPVEELEEYLLDDGTTGIIYNMAAQGLSQSSALIKVATWGLGRGNSVSTRFLRLSDMVLASGIDELLRIVSEILGRSSRGFENAGIRRVYELARVAENISYNDGGQLSSTAASILSGDDGTLTSQVLSNLSARMSMEQIPTFENGLRVGVINPMAVATLRESVSDKLVASSEAEIQEVLGIMQAGTLGDGIQRLRGYVGNYQGFMLFEDTALSNGLPGSNGVTELSTGVGNRTFRDNFFFGPGVAGHAVSSPVEIIEKEGDFRSSRDFTWRTTCGFGALDCSSHLDNSQQTRVRILRTLDAPV
jgi:hypothetical protein